MKLKDVTIGGKYRARVSGAMTTVRVLELKESSTFGGRCRTTIVAVNESTGRQISIRSAQRLRPLPTLTRIDELQRVNDLQPGQRAVPEPGVRYADNIVMELAECPDGDVGTLAADRFLELRLGWSDPLRDQRVAGVVVAAGAGWLLLLGALAALRGALREPRGARCRPATPPAPETQESEAREHDRTGPADLEAQVVTEVDRHDEITARAFAALG